ncbi:DUF1294 domain-containing protein [Phenylobacterium sp. VNQ135]|uniref:DUF1294 domain-containing protein n=1 Tax=Phenylobacterium sp. VNQ135 TaxID=3400922 RepID=UPI003C05E6DB
MLLAWIAVASLVTWFAFAADKRAAVAGERRTPEATLLLLAAAGGAPGAIAAQQLLRHKTRKEPFRSLLWSIAAAQAACAIWIALGR